MSNTEQETTFSIKMEPTECNICYNKESSFATTRCNHEMCSDCYQHIVDTNKCPFCRGILNEIIHKNNIPRLNNTTDITARMIGMRFIVPTEPSDQEPEFFNFSRIRELTGSDQLITRESTVVIN